MLKLAQMFAGGVLAAAATCPQISTCKGAGGSYKDLVLNSSAACCQACLDDGASCGGVGPGRYTFANTAATTPTPSSVT